MASVAISALPLDSTPATATTVVPAYQGVDTSNIKIDRAGVLYWIGRLDEVTVGASTTLPLTYADHQGKSIILSAAAAAYSLNATTQLTGFACEIINRTGSAYTIPAVTGATLDLTATHTKIASDGSASLTLYTHSGTIYARVRGDTEA